MKGALCIKFLSLKRLCGGVFRGSSFTGDPGRYVKKDSSGCWRLSPWGPLATRGTWCVGGSHTGDFNR
jgi:hypothetical protein